jgi:mannobiose 2-epimerase
MNAADYKAEVDRELNLILRYWMNYTPDNRQGGFVGRVDEADEPHPDAPRGLVLNSRILWAFSAAYHHTGRPVYRPVADRAYEYLLRFFRDKKYGGAFWSIDATGRPLDTRKQIYGQAFLLYGLSEYYRATGERTALDEAISLFGLIEKFSFDPERKGYYEAFDREWSSSDDLRLSQKETNDPKTMNTHLHVLEAYTNLYQCWPDPLLLQQLLRLLEVFDRHIINGTTGHLGLFFNEEWKERSHIISYGHDIEAAWLLHEAALATGDNNWITKTGGLAIKIAAAAAEGLDADGGLWYETENRQLIREKHWWPQAEAMVGFLQAWQLSSDDTWWLRSTGAWEFVKNYIRAPAGKEWYWGITAGHTPMPGQDKAGFWKCPYHNSRACLEIMRRLK